MRLQLLRCFVFIAFAFGRTCNSIAQSFSPYIKNFVAYIYGSAILRLWIFLRWSAMKAYKPTRYSMMIACMLMYFVKSTVTSTNGIETTWTHLKIHLIRLEIDCEIALFSTIYDEDTHTPARICWTNVRWVCVCIMQSVGKIMLKTIQINKRSFGGIVM